MSKSTISSQANPDRIARTLARRSSSAAGTHGDRRLKRQKTRSAVNRRLVKEALA